MNLNWLDIVVLGLATWRITSLLVKEVGPFRMFIRLRELTGIQHDDDDNIFIIPGNVFAGILSCILCCSVWVGIGMTILYVIYPPFIYAAMALTLSAITIIFDRKSS